MMFHRLALSVLVLTLLMRDGLLLIVLEQTENQQQAEEEHERRLAELSRATTSFSVSLYRQLAAGSQGNLVFSPFSVYTALSMTFLATQGDAFSELEEVLGMGPKDGVYEALEAVLASLPSSTDANVTLRVANALYYDKAAVELQEEFSRDVKLHYGACPRPFERPNPENAINDWVNRQTGGKIQDFLKEGDITSDVVIMLLNAVFFQGKWRYSFNEKFTDEGGFTTASGEVVRVPMMYREGSFSVKAVGDGIPASVLELPYGNDNRFALFVLLPDRRDGLKDLEAQLSSQLLEEALTSMTRPSELELRLPKLKMKVKTSLENNLQAMGLTSFFRNADLTRMVRQSNSGAINFGRVFHEAVLEVNEQGTQAAAVTAIMGVALSNSMPSFMVNHPFLLVLRDKQVGLNLFMARVTDPTSL